MNKVIEALENSKIEDIFPIDMNSQEWVWINKDIYIDLLNNALAYEEVIEALAEEFNPEEFELTILEILRRKMKDSGWLEVNQILFHEIEKDFNPTIDIQTYIFANRKFFIKNINRIAREMAWVFRAMAIDAYQHLIPEEGSLQQIFDGYFNDNFIIIEELIVKGSYSFNQGSWKYNKKENSLLFSKLDKDYRHWGEGNTNAIFRELVRN